MNLTRINASNMCWFLCSIFKICVCFDKSYSVFLQTHITNSSKTGEFDVFLNCTTHIPPLGDVAEFLLNNKTVASVGYYNQTCLVKRRSCFLNECDCTPYYYMLKLTTQLSPNHNSFTCQLRFSENKKHFKIFRTVLYGGLVLIDEFQTNLKAGQLNDTKEINASTKKDNTGLLHIMLPCGVILLVVVVLVVVCLCRKDLVRCKFRWKSRHKGMQNSYTLESDSDYHGYSSSLLTKASNGHVIK